MAFPRMSADRQRHQDDFIASVDCYDVQERSEALEWCLDGLLKRKVDCFDNAIIRKLKSKLVQSR